MEETTITQEELSNHRALREKIRRPRKALEQRQEMKIREAAQAIELEIAELEAQALVAYNRVLKYKDCKGKLYAKAKEAAAVYDAINAEIEDWRALKREIYKRFFRCFAKWKGQLYAGIVSTYVFVTTDWKYIAQKYKVPTKAVVEAINDYQGLKRKARKVAPKAKPTEEEEALATLSADELGIVKPIL